MSETEIVRVGDPLPELASVRPAYGHSIEVTWAAGPRRERTEVVDLAPDIFTYKVYRPLRDDPDLFQTVHVAHDGIAVAWGDQDEIDMPATAIERLAEEAMSLADFVAFLERHRFTFDAAAAELGISRRLVAYYAAGRPIPRTLALACAYIDVAQRTPAAGANHPRHTARADPIEGVEGIGKTHAEKLKAAGIKTTDQLLERTKDRKGR